MAFLVFVHSAAAPAEDWSKYSDQPASWYGSAEGRQIVQSVLARQRECGGWNKNYDPSKPVDLKEIAKNDGDSGTFDNNATVGELRFLARAYQFDPNPQIRAAFDRGLAFVFEAQYENGGWPQYYPLVGGYHDAITYNDDAMYHVMTFVQEIAAGRAPFDFLSADIRKMAEESLARGLRVLLESQVVVDGKRTVWCAQYDAETLEPILARAYEHPSLSGSESVKLIQLLMSIDDPSPQIVEAVQAGVAWFDHTAIPGVTYQRITVEDGSKDRRLVNSDDPQEKWWARFYEIGTNRPIFSGRDGVIRYDLSEVELERRLGYAWYSQRAMSLLDKDYPAWQKRWAPK